MRATIATIACLLAFVVPAAAQSAAVPQRAAAAPPGASSCSGCHDAKIASPSVPPLKGRPVAEIVTAMEAFRAGSREATVMTRIAKGYSDDESRAIAAWLSSAR
jgi:sulfide dehydrogenase cytochrome subunit